MVAIALPFSKENKIDEHGEGIHHCEFYQKLPSQLQEVVEENPHLFDYLHMVPIKEVGIPAYHPELSRKMGDLKEPNIIYPVGDKTFAHILTDFQHSRNHYIVVEPALIQDLDSQMMDIEDKCIDLGDRLPPFDPNRDHKEQLMEYIDMVKDLDAPSHAGILEKFLSKLRRNRNGTERTTMTEHELEGVRYLFIRDKAGLGTIHPLVDDIYIEDISCSGLGQVFIEHKIFGSLKSTITFHSFENLDQFVLRLAERINKPVTYRNPIADAMLPGGSRINIVYGRDVSKRGSNFSIRRFAGVPLSIFELAEFGTINYQMLAYLALALDNGMNLFVAGESASGKTTLLNALTTFIRPTAKIITIEDTPELQVPHANWIREVVQSTKVDDTSGAVTMFDLLKAALRQRPNEIIVGEIRGPEGNIAFQAMQTGHSVMATFHAASIEKLIQRLTSNPILVPRTYIDNLNVVVLMASVRLPGGKVGRRVTGINEIVGYDPTTESFNIIEAFHWDEATDSYEFTGHMSSHILESKIGPMLGMGGRKRPQIYAELEKRARILQRLHKEQHVRGFYEILEVLGQAKKQGLF